MNWRFWKKHPDDEAEAHADAAANLAPRPSAAGQRPDEKGRVYMTARRAGDPGESSAPVNLLGEAPCASGGLPLSAARRSTRSSVEQPSTLLGQMSSLMAASGVINPSVPIEFLTFLELYSVINMDVSQVVDARVRLANTGHEVIIDDKSDRLIESAVAEINGLARSVYPGSAGVDGLLNHYFRQLAVTGAISSEDVLTDRFDGVDRVVLVPVRQIRFKAEDGRYRPCQKPASILSGMTGIDKLIALSPETYHYYAAETLENSPYAIPPMAAAVESLLFQKDALSNLKFILRKLGLMGLVSLSVAPPPRSPGESDKEFKTRCAEYLTAVADALAANYRDGVLVSYNDQELKHFNVSSAGGPGAKVLMEMVEEFGFSGMKFFPIMAGRSHSASDSSAYARVIYKVLGDQNSNYQRLVKRRQEATYRTHLRLRGSEPADVTVRFDDTPSISPNEDAQAESLKQAAVIARMDRGIIDPDQAARELGYDQAADPERALDSGQSSGFFSGAGKSAGAIRAALPRRFRFDKARGLYEFSRPRIAVVAASPESIGGWVADYLAEVSPTAVEARDLAMTKVTDLLASTRISDYSTADDFADAIYATIDDSYRGAFSKAGVSSAVKKNLEAAYRFYRLTDSIGAGTIARSFDPVDARAIAALVKNDKFFVSSFVDNAGMRDPVREFLKTEFLEKGEGIFGRGSPETLGKFRGLFDDKLAGVTDAQVSRIVDTSVARTRSWGHIGQLSESGWDEAEIVNGPNPCELCAAKGGTRFKVAKARKRIEHLASRDPEEFVEELKAAPAGGDFPLFHPRCHCRTKPVG